MTRFAGSIIRFFVYSNFFIALCAILMVDQTYWLLIHTPIDLQFIGFVFFSTICSYSFHWYLTADSLTSSDRIKWLNSYRYIHVVSFFIGLAGSVFFVFHLLPWWPWLVLSAFVTFLYSAPKIPHPYFRVLRKVALAKTIFLAFVWMYVTSILPVIISDKEWDTAAWLFVLHRFFLIYAICILFDYRDRADDKKAGIRSLITYLNEEGITYVFIGSITIATMAPLIMLKYDYSSSSVLLLLVPCILTAALYNYARKNFSDMFYYFAMDGLMALSAVLMWIASVLKS